MSTLATLIASSIITGLRNTSPIFTQVRLLYHQLGSGTTALPMGKLCNPVYEVAHSSAKDKGTLHPLHRLTAVV